MRKISIGLTLALALGLSGCGYNTFQSTDEQVKASWAEVINQYQRRDHRRQQPAGKRIQQACCQRHTERVVDERKHQVLPDRKSTRLNSSHG